MFNTVPNACASTSTLVRIADAQWTPYIANTLQNWAHQALAHPTSCTQCRATDCPHCMALHNIIEMPWSVAVAHRIQELARNAIGRSSGREVLALVRNSA
ncbi:hypothetical protein [Dokdonella sp.]|uniref:hypothetical protein n=1 Tax=Dokdonella sp. TaxID=2291710 RepID=UPI00352945FB